MTEKINYYHVETLKDLYKAIGNLVAIGTCDNKNPKLVRPIDIEMKYGIVAVEACTEHVWYNPEEDHIGE